MHAHPQLDAAQLKALLADRFDQLCDEVAAAVNAALPGNIINQSEEPVRDAVADFRVALFQAALQFRLDAAQAAFSPSDASQDQQTPSE